MPAMAGNAAGGTLAVRSVQPGRRCAITLIRGNRAGPLGRWSWTHRRRWQAAGPQVAMRALEPGGASGHPVRLGWVSWRWRPGGGTACGQA